jgi:hypothetical protein
MHVFGIRNRRRSALFGRRFACPFVFGPGMPRRLASIRLGFYRCALLLFLARGDIGDVHH